MRYKTGELVQLGDCVAIERGATKGKVEAILETPDQLAEWGSDDPGILIAAEPFGLVLWPPLDTYDPVIFVSRRATPGES